jgi:hypothetical protein
MEKNDDLLFRTPAIVSVDHDHAISECCSIVGQMMNSPSFGNLFLIADESQ